MVTPPEPLWGSHIGFVLFEDSSGLPAQQWPEGTAVVDKKTFLGPLSPGFDGRSQCACFLLCETN